MRKLCVVGAFAFSGMSMLAVVSLGQANPSDGTVQKILNDWATRQERVRTIRYTLSGTQEDVTVEIPQVMAAKGVKLPPGKKVHSYKAVVTIDVANKWHRIEYEGERPSVGQDRWVPHVTVSAYNGDASQLLLPRDRNELDASGAELFIAKGRLRNSQIHFELHPLFLAHGIVATVSSPLLVDDWPLGHEADEFAVQGAVLLAGRRCTVLATEPVGKLTDEIWVDPSRESAVVRKTDFTGKEPWIRSDIEYQETPHGWLPSKWVSTNIVNGKVRSIHRLAIEGFETNLSTSKADFTIPVLPGMIVMGDDYPEKGKGLDPSKPARTVYKSGGGSERQVLEQTGFTTSDGKQLPPEDNSSSRWLIGGALGLLLVIAITAFGVVRTRNRFRNASCK